MLLCTNVVFMDFVCVYIYFAYAKKTSIQFRILVAEYRCRNKKQQQKTQSLYCSLHFTVATGVFSLSIFRHFSPFLSIPFSHSCAKCFEYTNQS